MLRDQLLDAGGAFGSSVVQFVARKLHDNAVNGGPDRGTFRRQTHGDTRPRWFYT